MSAPQPTLFTDPDYERRQAQKMRGQKAVIKVAYGNPDNAPPTFRERGRGRLRPVGPSCRPSSSTNAKPGPATKGGTSPT